MALDKASDALRGVMGDKIEKISDQVSEQWKKFKPYYDKAKPYIEQAKPYLKKAYVLACQAYDLFMTKVWPYYSHDAVTMTFAIVLLFFGGQFALTIACVQAFKMTGAVYINSSMEQMKKCYNDALEHILEDEESKNLFDENDDGDIDWYEIFIVFKELATAADAKEKERAKKRLTILMKAIDPNILLDALGGFWMGVAAIISTLRSRFAYCVSLGTQIGQTVCQTLKDYTQKPLRAMFPGQEKWVDFAIRSACGILGIIISLFLARVVSAVSSSLQGATALTKWLHRWYNEMTRDKSKEALARKTRFSQYVFSMPAVSEAGSKLNKNEKVTMYALASLGFLFQLWTRFDLPWLIKLPLFPVYVLEGCLSWVALV